MLLPSTYLPVRRSAVVDGERFSFGEDFRRRLHRLEHAVWRYQRNNIDDRSDNRFWIHPDVERSVYVRANMILSVTLSGERHDRDGLTLHTSTTITSSAPAPARRTARCLLAICRVLTERRLRR